VTDAAEAANQDVPPPPAAEGPAAAHDPLRLEEPAQWLQSSGPSEPMRWLAEGFAANFAAVASSLLRADLRVRLAGAAEGLRSHFTRSLEELTCTYALSAPEADDAPRGLGELCVEFSPALAFGAIECLLGGAPSTCPAPDRPLTAAERRVLHRLADACAMGLGRSWPEAGKPRLRAKLEPALPPPAATDERVLVITFELAVGERVGTMRLCAGREAIDGAVLPRPAAQGGTGPLELTAALEDIGIDERELAGLAPGDIIATEVAADGEVIVRIGGIPKFAARLDTSDGRRALTITRRLDEPKEA